MFGSRSDGGRSKVEARYKDGVAVSVFFCGCDKCCACGTRFCVNAEVVKFCHVSN